MDDRKNNRFKKNSTPESREIPTIHSPEINVRRELNPRKLFEDEPQGSFDGDFAFSNPTYWWTEKVHG